MCALCTGAISLPDSELPCEVQLERFGKFMYQHLGEATAFKWAETASGGVINPSEQGRKILSSLSAGIVNGRAEDRQRDHRRRVFDRLFAVGLTLLGVMLGWGIAQVQVVFLG